MHRRDMVRWEASDNRCSFGFNVIAPSWTERWNSWHLYGAGKDNTPDDQIFHVVIVCRHVLVKSKTSIVAKIRYEVEKLDEED